MSRHALPSPNLTPTWTYALVGGLVSMPLTIGQYWLSGMGSHFSTSMILIGGLIAGYLAERNSAAAVNAGLSAGVIGGVPGYVWIFPALIETATAWSSPGAGVLLMGVMSVLVICIAALPGLLGGIAGGWLAKKLTNKRRPVSSI